MTTYSYLIKKKKMVNRSLLKTIVQKEWIFLIIF